MKFTVCLIIALVICSTFALQPKKMTSVQAKRVAEIRKGNSWASILLNLAELHVTSKGPLDELVAAIEDTIIDLGMKREKRDEAYVKRTAEHDALVAQLTSDIANTEQEIVETQEILEMLAEQKAALEQENVQMNQDINNLTQSMAEATVVREKQHDEFETKVAETEEALEAVEECLDILNEFQMNQASFVQVKNAKAKVQKAQSKIAKVAGVQGSLLNALVQVAMSSEFANPEAINKVIQSFNDIKNNMYASITSLNIDEEQNQKDFNSFIADSNAEIMYCKEVITMNNGLLIENAKNTVDNTVLLGNLQDNLATFQQALEDENTAFDEATTIYENWCEENDREIAVCQEALAVVSTVDMADYITDRVDAEDGLVSSGMATTQQHGQGTEVFDFDYQL